MGKKKESVTEAMLNGKMMSHLDDLIDSFGISALVSALGANCSRRHYTSPGSPTNWQGLADLLNGASNSAKAYEE
jgi:hypothetical protein